MRDIEGKTLRVIADELGYSERHIKRVSARNKRWYLKGTDKAKIV